MIFLKDWIINFLVSLTSLNNKKSLLKDLKATKVKIKNIIDVGCHKGQYIEFFLKNFKNIKKIYAFEPTESLVKIIKKNYRSNKIKFFLNLVGNKNVTTVFYQGHHERSSSTKKINKRSFYFFLKSFFFGFNILNKKVKIKQVKLDNYFNEFDQINFLKIDTEGNEFEVLLGAKKLFLNKKIDIVHIEILHHSYYLRYNKHKINSFLTKFNFKKVSSYRYPLLFAEDRLYIRKDLI